jgi:hypothetical protein
VVRAGDFQNRIMTKRPPIAERLDCGGFGAAVGTRGNHPFSKSSRLHESAAQAGAVQTLRVFPHVIPIRKYSLVFLPLLPGLQPPR